MNVHYTFGDNDRAAARLRRLAEIYEPVTRYVTRAPFPVGSPDLLLCRFLLTHLQSTGTVLAAWAAAAAPGGLLLVHEMESLRAVHPALCRYYGLVARLQGHYGQALDIGTRLDAAFAGSPWRVVDSRAVALEVPATQMAELHLANLRTWREDEYARRSFDRRELDELQTTLERIVAGEERAGVVHNTARQIIAELAT